MQYSNYLVPRFCTTVLQLQGALKKLAKPNVPKEAMVTEADLMSALQCGVLYNIPAKVVIAVSH